ncbi:PriCT-2 domain-containing protein [Marinilongibacter aquaticus]|uniref:BT4734/BF3469 family protein n=1 Tax=Marinilongibacter aquaticus TaxID=2975157 RepID=UPI0021BD895D|nr:BT4734/BF3469 family protein [Marinilongibacter aquaticus]UBM58273.1 PriCT-2 domain-containing protein [Marinilongibacter aquaticus]
MPNKEHNISFFKGPITNVVPENQLCLEDVIKLVRSDAYKIVCTGIRHAIEKKHADEMKRRLDYVTFGGVFDKRHIDNLIIQSGWIVMDFDHVGNLADTIEVLKNDGYIHAMFVSPSGKGLKVILEIGDQDFKKAFIDISIYFQQEYQLAPDMSGSDINRACFLSWDANAYYNDNAKSYDIRGYRKVKKERFDPEKKTEIGHLEYVVGQIVENQIDITNDYSSEWLLIGFSMATYGEPGRYYWHQISKQNANYDATNCDNKFDNFLATTRFTNPAKFFSIASDYGIDISKSSKNKNNKKDPPKSDHKPEDSFKPNVKTDIDRIKEKREELKIQTVWYYSDSYTITVKSGRSYKQVADCLIYIKYKTEDEREELTWVLEARLPEESIFIEVPHEDFCSASKLKKHFASKSISLRISDGELAEIHGFLFTETEYREALKVVRFGWNDETKTYLFSNVVWHAGALESPDDFGIVSVKSSIGKEVFVSVPNPKGSLKKRHELTDSDLSFIDFVHLYQEAHTYELSFIPLCFYVFSLFRDVAVKEKSFSPILFLKGGAGTGKSSMVRVLTAAFGRRQDGVNLKNKNTEAALVKIMSQTSNGIIWFDEYHNEFQYEGVLQAAYDNDGYHRSSDTNSIETNSVDIHSALALTSNYLPENPIFFSRCLFIPITNNQKTTEQRNAFYELEKWQDKGLGCLTVELLAYREDLVKNYKENYKHLFDEFRDRFKNLGVPERLMTNMAQVMVFPFILQRMRTVKMAKMEGKDDRAILDEFVRIGGLAIERQHRIMNESKAIAEFWEIIQDNYEKGLIIPDSHFQITGIEPYRELKVNFPKMYNAFAPRYRQVFMKSPPDRDTVQTEMATANGNNSWEEISKTIRFIRDAEGKTEGKSMPVKGCAILDYGKLQKDFGVDLECRKSNF